MGWSIKYCIKVHQMPVSDFVAPALSTAQDEETFAFARFDAKDITRPHLEGVSGASVEDRIFNFYDIDKICSFLRTSNHQRVALQFPDSLVCDSAAVAQELQRRLCDSEATDRRIWVLADTSYSSCCIDEVAAEHVNADLLIHFGDSCLNPPAHIASAYVFGKPHLDIESVVAAAAGLSNVVLMADAPYTRYLRQIAEKIGAVYGDLMSATIIDYSPSVSTGLETLNRVFNLEGELSDYNLLHITTPEAPRLLQLSTRFKSVTTYNPQNKEASLGPFPSLMRRYKFMHLARTAGTIGILVNTLSLANTKAVINGAARKIKEAGKKHYIFVVGKPNVAKLANFDAIDMWCVLGCDHQGIILDQYNEYFKPIITPYELLLALSDELTWTGQWVTDFKLILSDLGTKTAEKEIDDTPEFDPVTGKLVSTSRPLRTLQHLQITQEESDETALVKKLSTQVALGNTVSTSAITLQSRQWTGLGSDWTETADEDGAELEEGRAGIARGYGEL